MKERYILRKLVIYYLGERALKVLAYKTKKEKKFALGIGKKLRSCYGYDFKINGIVDDVDSIGIDRPKPEGTIFAKKLSQFQMDMLPCFSNWWTLNILVFVVV